MPNKEIIARAPVLYLPHGGGPLPLLGDDNHQSMVDFLSKIAAELGKPKSIVMISAHWEEQQATITSARQPEIIYDYSGFPAESYQIQYPAPGDQKLASHVQQLIHNAGLEARLDGQRGFDHGMFVPLKLMYPEADIPCVQLSLLTSLDPARHIALGKAIASLRQDNVLIIGSGMSFHNMREFFTPSADSDHQANEFDHWLRQTCALADISAAEREQRLIDWKHAPTAPFCHPREEHLLPLHVCFGVAAAETPRAEVVFNQAIMGKKVTSLLWR